MLALLKFSLLSPDKGAMAIALFPFRNPITDATGCLGENRDARCEYIAASGVPQYGWHSFCFHRE